MGKVSAIWIYPVKSCGGISVPTATLTEGGLAGDRRYMLVDETDLFVTQRTEPRLCLVSAAFAPSAKTAQDRTFCLSAQGFSELRLPELPAESLLSGVRNGSIWSDSVDAREYEPGSLWFSRFLGKKVRLLYQPEGALRQINPAYANEGERVSFADGYPLLLATEDSLADLNRRLDSPVGIERFRPNVVVSGVPAWDEDEWDEISLGVLRFRCPKLCDRCVVTTIDPESGEKGREPLRTLATFRKWDGAVWFAANLIPIPDSSLTAELSVGQPLRVLHRRPSPAPISGSGSGSASTSTSENVT